MKNGPYELVIAPHDYPGKKYRNRYCYEHHLVWWENTGEILKSDELIHHINGNKRDNRFCNLTKKKRSLHSKEHALKQGQVTAVLKCPQCKRVFERERRATFLVTNAEITFCSRRCVGRFNFPKATKEKIARAKSANLLRTYTRLPT